MFELTPQPSDLIGLGEGALDPTAEIRALRRLIFPR